MHVSMRTHANGLTGKGGGKSRLHRAKVPPRYEWNAFAEHALCTRWLTEIFIAFRTEYRWSVRCHCGKSYNLFTATVSIISLFLSFSLSLFRFPFSFYLADTVMFYLGGLYRF